MEEINALTFEDFTDVLLTAFLERRADERKSMHAAAFVAWRQEVTLTGMFGGKVLEGSNSFDSYLATHNLLTPAERAAALKKQEEARELRKAHTRATAEKYRAQWKAQLKK